MLYTLQIKGCDRINYLFGTIHLGSKEADETSLDVMRYIGHCNNFLGEMDITQVVPEFQKAFYLENGKTLRDLYSEKKIIKFEECCKKYFGLHLNDYLNLKPIFIISKLSEMLANHSGNSMDSQLFEFALSKGLTVGGLETPERQLEIASLIPIDYQIKLLDDTFKNVRKFKKKNRSLLDDYFDGKVKSIYKKSKKSLGKVKKLLLYERNHLMAMKIDQLLKERPDQSHFFCFGAAHLTGKKGIIAYLKRSGYIIKPKKGFVQE